MNINIILLDEDGSHVGELKKAMQGWQAPEFFQGETLQWSVECKHAPSLDDLMACEGSPNVLLGTNASLGRCAHLLRALEAQMSVSRLAKNHTYSFPAPVVAVLQSQRDWSDGKGIPSVVADWIYAPAIHSDLALRILFLLQRRGLFKPRLHFWGVTVFPELRLVTFEGRSSRLTPSDLLLLELFMQKNNSVVADRDLVDFFELNGKSASPNNIRVAIFELRLKLEELTHSSVTLVNIHKQGYCLRRRAPTRAAQYKYQDAAVAAFKPCVTAVEA